MVISFLGERGNTFFRAEPTPQPVVSQPIPSTIKSDIDAIIARNKLSQSDVYNYMNKKPLIIHCCHHKTGTVVIEKILRAVAAHFGMK